MAEQFSWTIVRRRGCENVPQLGGRIGTGVCDMAGIPQGWSGDDVRIAKTFTFKTFAQALGFMVEVGLFCEKADHHPEWKNVYNKVEVELTTHDAGRVTEKDIALAAHLDAVFARFASA
jgi:4a-hydroxytetrahydrobiopterin dehydratase